MVEVIHLLAVLLPGQAALVEVLTALRQEMEVMVLQIQAVALAVALLVEVMAEMVVLVR